VFDELKATPEVLYGAAIAFGIVVLLTPAVGGMARMLGAVDRPDSRRLNRRPVPRLGGLAIFLGIIVPSLAFLDLSDETRGVLLGAAERQHGAIVRCEPSLHLHPVHPGNVHESSLRRRAPLRRAR